MLKSLLIALTLGFLGSSSVLHPLTFGMLILIQSILICVISRMITSSSWIAMTLFLIMVGGLMIIFIYMTSICSNEIFHKTKKIHLQVFSILPLGFASMKTNNTFNDYLINMDIFNKEFFKFFLPLNIQSSIFSFIYLIFVLLIVVSLMEINKGPLRKKY
uniref:NADH dehydrogenase subunit 6 n=1 Tax=Anoeconeossa unicornuta TaxID=2218011 RepID=A0A344A250_9HEMI|nr:NADH dehydrogenase subunit 6 [Anoeconeossa unicornuta]AWU48841.1 NADH dehydrogenase subunit 6 [Anoeconeossa unicornuta]